MTTEMASVGEAEQIASEFLVTHGMFSLHHEASGEEGGERLIWTGEFAIRLLFFENQI